MTKEEKWNECNNFFKQLCEAAKGYTLVGSCNQDTTLYLIPEGTEDQITYSSKPDRSFRLSDHWNWYSNVRKCEKESYVQCLSFDLPKQRPRKGEGRPSDPIKAICVAAITKPGGTYKVIFGEKYDRKRKKWKWINNDPLKILNTL